MDRDLPTGTVTFLFSDLEGSTRLLREVGTDRYAELLSEHRRIVRSAIGQHGGVEFGTQGDSFCVVFRDADAALASADEIHRGLGDGPMRVRIGVHTGTPAVVDDDYVGPDLHLVARVAAAGHGGQTLVSAAACALAHVDLADLGEHRLKDFDEPVRLYQAGPGRFPPLRTISNTNLPRPPSSFVGRERELTDLLEVFAGGARLVTLTGPGGTGKTRLAIEAAAELQAETPDGVFWVDLAPLRDPSLVTETIAQTIGADGPLAERIGERRMLLVIDNLEQVVDAAGDLAALLPSCPHLRLLVTSRERLRVNGEVDIPVPSLADDEAVELFCARARLDPDDTIRRLCQSLDNLPLAVELAAARTNVLSPAQVLERLGRRLDLLGGGRDTEPRQRTLRSTIAWSYELLDPGERRLFARLAAFRGGGTLEAIENVCEADLDTLSSLVDKSLARHRDGRFVMLESIREYAGERLAESGEGETVRQRHATWFLDLAERAAPHLRGSPKEWLDRLEEEHDNLRAALDHFAESAQPGRSVELAGALWKFWYQRGHFHEGRRRLEAGLEAGATADASRGRALLGAGAIAETLRDLASAERRFVEARDLYGRLGDAIGLAHARFLLAGVFADRGDHARARDIYEESVASFREIGDDHYVLLALRAQAWTHAELGDPAGHRRLRLEHLELARATGNQRALAHGFVFLAQVATEEGRLDDAIGHVSRAYDIHRALGETLEVIDDLSQFAHLAAIAGRADDATRVLAACDELRLAHGLEFESWVAEQIDATLALVRGTVDDAAFAAAWEAGRLLGPDEAVGVATGGEVPGRAGHDPGDEDSPVPAGRSASRNRR